MLSHLDWKSVLPIWAIDLMDHVGPDDWRDRFDLVFTDGMLIPDGYVVYLFPKQDYVVDMVILAREDAEVLYKHRRIPQRESFDYERHSCKDNGCYSRPERKLAGDASNVVLGSP